MNETNDRPLLILDLDETLIYSEDHARTACPAFTFGPYFVYTRPGLSQFLAAMAELFDIGIWSSGACEYVATIVERIFPAGIVPAFVWSRERCSERQNPHTSEVYFQKDLKKVVRRGYALRRIIIVEDNHQNVENNYGNAVYIKPFTGQTDDTELHKLSRFLRKIASTKDFRTVEKRTWRSAIDS